MAPNGTLLQVKGLPRQDMTELASKAKRLGMTPERYEQRVIQRSGGARPAMGSEYPRLIQVSGRMRDNQSDTDGTIQPQSSLMCCSAM